MDLPTGSHIASSWSDARGHRHEQLSHAVQIDKPSEANFSFVILKNNSFSYFEL